MKISPLVHNFKGQHTHKALCTKAI